MSIARQYALVGASERPAARIIRGLKDAIAFANGDETRGRLIKLSVETKPETVIPSETVIPRKRGRPAKPETEKPWVAEGLSRAAWYRRQAARKAQESADE